MRRCRGVRHRLFAEEAGFAEGGSDRDWYYGVKSLLVVSPEGQVTDFVLGPGSTEDHWMAEALLRWQVDPDALAPTVEQLIGVLGKKRHNGEPWVGPTGPLWSAGVGEASSAPYLGDRGFVGRVWNRHWLEHYGALVLTKADYKKLACPPSDPEKAKRESRQGRHQLGSLRQIIESVNGFLLNVLGLAFPKARTIWGLLARVGAKIAAFNIAIHFNTLTDRSRFSVFDPFA